MPAQSSSSSSSSSTTSSKSRARQFYKKNHKSLSTPSTLHSSDSIDKKKKKSKKNAAVTSKNSKATPSNVSDVGGRPLTTNSTQEKRAKAKFYQEQTHMTTSWYALKYAMKEQLEYVLDKYPVHETVKKLKELEECVMTSPQTTTVVTHNKSKYYPKLYVYPQLSRVALDKIWLFCAKRAESLLVKAFEYTTSRKQQTTTLEDLLLAYADIEKTTSTPSFY